MSASEWPSLVMMVNGSGIAHPTLWRERYMAPIGPRTAPHTRRWPSSESSGAKSTALHSLAISASVIVPFTGVLPPSNDASQTCLAYSRITSISARHVGTPTTSWRRDRERPLARGEKACAAHLRRCRASVSETPLTEAPYTASGRGPAMKISGVLRPARDLILRSRLVFIFSTFMRFLRLHATP